MAAKIKQNAIDIRSRLAELTRGSWLEKWFRHDTSDYGDKLEVAERITIDNQTGDVTVDTEGRVLVGRASSLEGTSAEVTLDVAKRMQLSSDTSWSNLDLATDQADGDGVETGRISFCAMNQSGAEKRVAEIAAQTEGTTVGDRGGRLVFRTGADGGAATNDRMVITDDGHAQFAAHGATPTSRFHNTVAHFASNNGSGANMVLHCDQSLTSGETVALLIYGNNAGGSLCSSSLEMFPEDAVTKLQANRGSLLYQADSSGQGADSYHAWEIDGAQKMKLDHQGDLMIGSGSTAGSRLAVNQEDSTDTIHSQSSAASPFGMLMDFSAAAPNNTSNYYLRCRDNASGGTNRAFIYSNGDMKNVNGSYATISDERVKQDVVEARSQWDDFKQLRFVNFRRKQDVLESGEEALVQLGLIAQEVQAVSPGLVDYATPSEADKRVCAEFAQEGERVMGVKQSIVYMKAAKALQEAMARIETLEAEMAALKAGSA